MSERQRPSKTTQGRAYKRSWKNLLLNKRYQLRFTLFMVAICALVLGGLGMWVMRVADSTTEVGITRIQGEQCPSVPSLAAIAKAAHQSEEAIAAGDQRDPSDATADAATADAATADAATAERPRARVQIGETSMSITAAVPSGFVTSALAKWQCELAQVGHIASLEQGRRRILTVLVLCSVGLLLGLAVYGIKMTHRVAGPLYKVGLYLAKMRDGRLDEVYNLRKGDQLIEFYEHFKAAHAGLVAMERSDLERLRGVVAEAERAGLGQTSSEIAERISELKAVIARKEGRLE